MARDGYGGGINVIVKSDLEACKKDLQNFIGSRIRLTSNGGRKRIIVHEGVLDHCYPNVFTVRCSRQNCDMTPEVVSYSYVDVLTKAVEIAMVSAVSVSAG
ncbi:MAG: Veg family protein [Clostridiales bacterium]|nr:Veg family protein [Clostridiales bacterium]